MSSFSKRQDDSGQGKLGEMFKIESVLIAEFDIDVGSSITHQYPQDFIKKTQFTPEMKENSFAELMLPDGAHLRDEDWTYSMLKQASKSSADVSTSSLTNIPCFVKVKDEGIIVEMNAILAIEGNSLILTLPNNTITIKYDDETRFSRKDHNFDISTATGKTSLRTVSSEDTSKIETHLKYLDTQNQKAEDTGTRTKIYYLINLVRTKHIPGVKRGARVKAMAIISEYPFCHVFKPLLILALEKFFIEPSPTIIEKLYNSLNNCDIDTIPQLSLGDKTILRGGNSMILFPEEPDSGLNTMSRIVKTVSITSNGKSRTVETKIVFDGIQHLWETKLDFDDVPVPIKIPLDTFPEEIADFSVTQLVQTFHSVTLKPNEPSGLMVILHSLISQRRILFVGYQLPAGDVAKCVLAACSLCTPVLKGFSERAFPYTCLTNLDQLLECPGYIAGVTNPTFQSHEQWWDVLCDIPSGKVTISPKLGSTTGYGWVPGPNFTEEDRDQKERDLIAKDLDFMKEVMGMINSRYHDLRIRQHFIKYVKRFTQLAASFELDKKSITSGVSKVSRVRPSMRSRSNTASQNTSHSTLPHASSVSTLDGSVAAPPIGPKAVFSDELAKKKELAMYAKRIESWKETISYKIYSNEWQQKLQKRLAAARIYTFTSIKEKEKHEAKERHSRARFSSVVEANYRSSIDMRLTDDYLYSIADDLDPAAIVEKLRKGSNMEPKDILKLYQMCLYLVSSEETLSELLQHLPIFDGGLTPITFGLFHPAEAVRTQCLSILVKLQQHKLGDQFLVKLNPFLEYTFKRMINKSQSNRLAAEITGSKEHLLGSTSTVYSEQTNRSYISHEELFHDDDDDESVDISIEALSLESPRESLKRIYGTIVDYQSASRILRTLAEPRKSGVEMLPVKHIHRSTPLLNKGSKTSSADSSPTGSNASLETTKRMRPLSARQDRAKAADNSDAIQAKKKSIMSEFSIKVKSSTQEGTAFFTDSGSSTPKIKPSTPGTRHGSDVNLYKSSEFGSYNELPSETKLKSNRDLYGTLRKIGKGKSGSLGSLVKPKDPIDDRNAPATAFFNQLHQPSQQEEKRMEK